MNTMKLNDAVALELLAEELSPLARAASERRKRDVVETMNTIIDVRAPSKNSLYFNFKKNTYLYK